MADTDEQNKDTLKPCGHSETDDCNCECGRKPLDVNKYATKKTIAQGMLDIALLTANASQLKYILQVGEKHEFYSLMLGLISISIILQIVQAIIQAILGTALNINKTEDQDNANKINNTVLALNIVIVAINVIISAFDIKAGDQLNGNDTAEVKIFHLNGSDPLIFSYNELNNVDNWKSQNLTMFDNDYARLQQDFVQVFNKIKEIYLNNQTSSINPGFILNSDNVNEFMEKILMINKTSG